MKRMILPKRLVDISHDDDVDRMIDICLDHGYKIESHIAEQVWMQFSEDLYAASWMRVDGFEDDIVFEVLYDNTDQVEEWER